MAARTGTAHVVTTTRTYKDQVYRTHLLRRSYREDGKVKNETLGNLSHLPDELIEIIRRSLQGETFVPVACAFEITRSRPHGHVQAAGAAMVGLEMASLLASKPCRERDLVLAMVAARIVAPHTKLATTRWWHTTTLAEDFGVADADEDDLYAAMDWLLERQDRIQARLAPSERWRPGAVRPVLQLLRGQLLSAGQARLQPRRQEGPAAGQLRPAHRCARLPRGSRCAEGNVADSLTLLPEVKRLREDFGIEQLVMVGDRGMISNKAIEELRETEGVGWISMLLEISIRALVEQGHLQLGLFDERNLLELSSPDYPGERLVACRNPELAKLRSHKRLELLAATEANLQKIKARVDAGKLAGKDEIGLRVGKVSNQYKMPALRAGHRWATFTFARKTDAIAAEAALDGLYIIRTSVPPTQMDSADCVRNYKSLANVERAFRTLKTLDLTVRPIHHRTADRVRAHIFLCMLAYYVEWHMREAWRELMFADTDQQAKAVRDPVAPATRSKAALAKAARHALDDGTPVHNFSTLMAELATIVRNTCRAPRGRPRGATFELLTNAQPLHLRAIALVQNIKP